MAIYKQFRYGFYLMMVFIAALLCNSCEEDEVQVPNDAIILLEVLDGNNLPVTELPGDGETLLKLQAKIPHDADDKYRKVTFRTSKGQFMATSNGVYEKSVNADGVAEVYLKVPLDHGPLFFSAEIGSDSDKYFSEKSITLIDVGQVIHLEILDHDGNPLSNGIQADGSNVLTVKATVNFNGSAVKSIKFLTSDGTYLSISSDDNIVATDNNVAIIRYRVPKNVGDVYFRAEASANTNIFQSSAVPLSRANADHVILEPSVLLVDSPDDQVTVTTYLTRDSGYVSTGTAAQYSAFQLDSNGNEVAVGRFTGLAQAKTNENGQITAVKFVPDTGDIDFEKPMTIKVTAMNDQGVEVSQSFILNN